MLDTTPVISPFRAALHEALSQQRNYTDGWRARLAGKPLPGGVHAVMGYTDADAAIKSGRVRADADVNREGD